MTGAALTHGWLGLLTAFATVQVPMFASMVRNHAPLKQYLIAPAVAAPLTVMTGLGMSLANPVLQSIGLGAQSPLQWMVGAGLGAWLGYIGGGVVARAPDQAAEYRRGTVIDENSAVSPRGRNPAAAHRFEQTAALNCARPARARGGRRVRGRRWPRAANHAGRNPGAGRGRSQALQVHRHDRNR